MPLPSYYSELYVAVCRTADSFIIGSGLCYDGAQIMTCAHVVNTALDFDPTDLADKTGQEVQLRFSQSTVLDCSKTYTAKVTRWFPSTQDGKLKLENDLAVLTLDDEEAQAELQTPAGELRFSADKVMSPFLCISHNTRDADEDTFLITGTIQQYFPKTGKTQLSTSANANDAFFRPGSSGSPVFSETLDGISGIVDQLVRDDTQATYANMIDARRIEFLLKDIIVHQPSLQKKNREEKKFLCDRKEVLEGIEHERVNGNFFFLWGNHRQEGYDFSNRYRQEFLQPSDFFITVDLPSEVPALFKSRFYEAMAQSARNSNKRIELKAGDDIFTCYRLLQRMPHKGFLFRIYDFNPENSAGYEWFIKEFLRHGETPYPDDLHILLMYEYIDAEAEDAVTNRDKLMQLFGIRASFPLENVSQKDIRSWITLFNERNSSPFIQKLLELLDGTKNYPMLDIFRKYEEAKRQIPDHEKF